MLKRGWIAAAAALACLSTGTALGQSAQGRSRDATERSGLDVSVRTGFARPLGELEQGTPLSDGLSGAIPLVLEVGLRGKRNVSVGFALEMAPALTKNCQGGGCSATDYRLNAEAIFTARTGAGVDPWLGIGAGYEWLDLGDGSDNSQVTGWTYLVIQAGAELRIGRELGLGPFVSFSLGECSSESSEFSSIDIASQGLHEWLEVGLRGTINL